jgi:hypothetical protein
LFVVVVVEVDVAPPVLEELPPVAEVLPVVFEVVAPPLLLVLPPVALVPPVVDDDPPALESLLSVEEQPWRKGVATRPATAPATYQALRPQNVRLG